MRERKTERQTERRTERRTDRDRRERDATHPTMRTHTKPHVHHIPQNWQALGQHPLAVRKDEQLLTGDARAAKMNGPLAVDIRTHMGIKKKSPMITMSTACIVPVLAS